MSKARLISAALALLAVAALAAVLLAKQEDAAVVFPDGSRIELLGTAVGGQVFTTEKRWHKVAKRWVPSRFHRLFPPVSSGSCSSSTNSVTVYFKLTDLSGAFTRGGLPWDGYGADDDTGFRYARDGGYCSFGGGATPQILGLSLRAYPRRQAEFNFQFFDAKRAVLGSLRVPNPLRGPFVDWKPAPLPQSQTNGPVTLTLEGLQERGNAQSRYASPKWKLTATNSAWANAKARYFTLRDATGNEGQWLSPREPAWIVSTVVHREKPEEFGPEERFRIDDISIPKAGELVALDQSHELDGVRLKVLLVAGAGRLIITNGVTRAMFPPSPGGDSGNSRTTSGQISMESWGSRTPFLLVEAENVERDDEVRLRLLDDRGREMKLDSDSGWEGMNGGGRRYRRGFTPLPDAKTLSLEVIVSRPLPFEFMVDPKDVQPATSSGK